MTKEITVTPISDVKELRQAIIEGIQDRKGHEINIVEMSEIESAPAREFVICQGNSTQQVAAIADSVRDYLLEHHDVKPYNYEGYRNSQWIVLDYGTTMVHIFTREMRQLYNLEELWADAPVIVVPDVD